jgi:DNA-binding transcriptional regulator YhcF (GntR family)
MANASEIAARETQRGERLSYKFQRLRERLRDAVTNGELSGKLPGERELAKRFKANPKTLSKALTDLAAEGLLERSIGRGTYVKGTSAPEDLGGRWLILVDEVDRKSAIVEQLLKSHSDAEAVVAGTEMRPSFISQFCCFNDLFYSLLGSYCFSCKGIRSNISKCVDTNFYTVFIYSSQSALPHLIPLKRFYFQKDHK